jgi:hypothetical protein
VILVRAYGVRRPALAYKRCTKRGAARQKDVEKISGRFA